MQTSTSPQPFSLQNPQQMHNPAPNPTQTPISPEDIVSFSSYIAASKRILLFLGAGLSAPSGIPTFRGPNTSWRGFPPRDLSTPYVFKESPVLFWHFFNHRRSLALRARPNEGHFALARLAGKRGENCLAISQNIDGLSLRAGHTNGVVSIHGSLFETECNNTSCTYAEANYDNDPIVPGLAVPNGVDISDPSIPLPPTTEEQLPHCPECGALMRPSVVLFAEKLYQNSLDEIEAWFEIGDVDLLLVIGTNASVYPAAGYIERARDCGARVAVINTAPPGFDDDDFYGEDHWYFQGDAAELLPVLLRDSAGLGSGEI